MSFSAAIFDLDGTLLDTLDDLTDSVNYALALRGHEQRSREQIRTFVGNGVKKLIERALPDDADKAEFDETMKLFKDCYEEHKSDKTKPYEGMTELLKTLKKDGIKIAVFSNKHEDAAAELCEKYFQSLTDIVLGGRNDRRLKPYPDGINIISDKLGVPKSEIIYIGDSETDVETGRNADVYSVAVTWGFRTEEQLKNSGAEHFADTAEDIQNIISDSL